MSFRPLWGTFLFLYVDKYILSKTYILVSVPYGELFYFYNPQWELWGMDTNSFRPLWGTFLFLL